MILVYLLIFGIFSCFAYGQLKHYRLIKSINNITSSTTYIPLIVTGRTVKAFTIEKSKLVTASQTVAIDAFSYFVYAALSFFAPNIINLNKRYTEYARKLAYAKIHNQSLNADYIVNIREQIHYADHRHIHIFVSCNALYRFQDTLPIYTFNKELIGAYIPTPNAPVIKALTASLGGTLCLLISAKLIGVLIAQYMTNNLSIETEKAMWSYVQNSVLNEQPTRSDVARSQQILRDLLTEVAPTDSEYDFELFVTQTDDVDATLFPAGKILVTKGLIETLANKNEAVFALQHFISHYHNKDHLRVMGPRLLSLASIAKVSSIDGWIGKAMIWQVDFKDASFSDEAEIRSDKYAVEAINEKFNNVTGYDFFLDESDNISSGYIALNHSHPSSYNRIQTIKEYIASKEYSIGEATALNFKLQNIAEAPKLEAGASTISDPMMNTFTNYKADMDAANTKYQAYIQQFEGILQLDQSITSADLKERQAAAIQASSEVMKFKQQFSQILSQYNKDFEKLIETSSDAQKEFIQTFWSKEYKTMSAMINFYIKRDKAIFENQAVLLQFLGSRYGTYSFTPSGLSFSTNKERDDYIILQNRITDLIKQAPPAIDND